MPMPLNQLLPQAAGNILIRELTLDSRKVRPGDLFLAVPGHQQDGRVHIADAISRGAAAIAYEAEGAAEMSTASAVLVPVRCLAEQLSAIAGRFYGEPSRSLHLAGVTGTNGKTSVTYLIAQALDRLGERCGIIGTLGTGFHGELILGQHTTPDAIGVQANLANLRKQGARAVAMEVSSHGLAQGRVAALAFDVAVFTNLSRDHLDYHGSMEAYAAVKAQLFKMPGLSCRVINLDDSVGRALAAERAESRLITYSLDDASAYLYCPEAQLDDNGIHARLVTPQGERSLRSPLLGRFNVSNLLAAVGALLGMNYPLDEILAVLPDIQGPAGRMQCLGGGDRPLVVVDYAHTPDALEKVLDALRPHTRGNLLCLFGCGGDRDRGKRALMADVAERLADRIVVTDDNPRNEDPLQILDEIRAGFSDPERAIFISGRAEAIAQCIAGTGIDDVVLLAGKGHEDYQEIKGERLPFSDLDQASIALAAWRDSDA
ncbi:UDP-N-acetylmuramoylalanyl-D-glutamate--2,6-diaminopimelate ligase [Stutzerimonas stutzeri]|uniref:UDP-N-acetylmuramoyl-L-alanyl-D-glutamate--2,6-diaminopimelate ligase n=1 Tax=Stutzerimonas stutzeri TaxID=316 RepID=W8R250_STUST|nr:UDP-N-acetylmuramoyl-L-alanyl-D-glutamate--2,6-diaminopimelate ligase [Stutzerimonas stutzeri]AHL76679.1 UDP-N-acetylmuramoylalanyl-D-glutamate--2,6-diaminopimelate ligase [Stutzerimonas stutzeri]MCQ4331163.1 UDP-N-acetylmuramoyl-L-alanyl-D-glutamate--2,6-diaminopimelate ligase [Stutzerimonas stutzeri]